MCVCVGVGVGVGVGASVGGSTSGWRSVGECGGVCRRNYTIKWCPDGRQLGATGYGPFSSCHSESICIVMAPCFPFLRLHHHPPVPPSPIRHPLTYKYRYGSFPAEGGLALWFLRLPYSDSPKSLRSFLRYSLPPLIIPYSFEFFTHGLTL